MEWTVAIGIDTHKDTHTAVALDRLGVQVGSCEIETTRVGYLRLVRFAQALGEPAFAIEGAGSYGAGLASLLLASGFPVYEVERPRRRERRQGKSDLLDAARAAGRLLSGDEPARFSVYRWLVRCCRGCGLRSGCVGLPSPASSCNRSSMSFWRA